MHLSKLAIIIYSLVFLLPTYAGAEEQDQLVLVAPILPPYYDVTTDGRESGVLHDLFETLVMDAGYSWTRKTLPPKRAIRYFVTSDSTITIAVRNPAFSNLDHILVAERPIGNMVLNLYQPTGRPVLKDIPSLKNKNLVLLRGYGYGGLRTWLDDPANGIVGKVTGSNVEGLRLLEQGFVDAVLYYDVNHRLAVEQLGYVPKNITVQNLMSVPLYIQINRKTLPGARVILDELMKSHDRLIKQGHIKLLGSLVSG